MLLSPAENTQPVVVLSNEVFAPKREAAWLEPAIWQRLDACASARAGACACACAGPEPKPKPKHTKRPVMHAVRAALVLDAGLTLLFNTHF